MGQGFGNNPDTAFPSSHCHPRGCEMFVLPIVSALDVPWPLRGNPRVSSTEKGGDWDDVWCFKMPLKSAQRHLGKSQWLMCGLQEAAGWGIKVESAPCMQGGSPTLSVCQQPSQSTPCPKSWFSVFTQLGRRWLRLQPKWNLTSPSPFTTISSKNPMWESG